MPIKFIMPKERQNLIFLYEPSNDAWDVSLKAGNSYMNRFFIDEDIAAELAGINYLHKSSDETIYNNNSRKKKGRV